MAVRPFNRIWRGLGYLLFQGGYGEALDAFGECRHRVLFPGSLTLLEYETIHALLP